MEEATGESQEVILLCNMEEEELLSDPGFDFEDDEEDSSDDPEEVFYEDN